MFNSNIILNATQRAWFKSATIEEKRAFVVKGKASYGELFNSNTRKISFCPRIRGVIFGGEYTSPNKAITAAQELLAEMKEMPLADIDESSLGISTVNQELAASIEDQSNFSVDAIIHLATLVNDRPAWTNSVSEFIESAIDEGSHLYDYLASHKLKHVQHFHKNLVSIDEDADELSQIIIETGTAGWLVNGQYIGSGYRQIRWFYGETYEEALAEARAWAESKGADEDKTK
ncbi:hypothetical protein [Rappaport israeli]|uniref:hypothetical protein n=1 Tax=Rappaport israeli TaxID=1839807 RepID=UPI0009302BDA|nr:hypothetical protein [Rappaport israeli]